METVLRPSARLHFASSHFVQAVRVITILTVAPGATSVSVDFQPIGANMSCQLVYRATDGSVVYSYPVTAGTCTLNLDEPVQNNVVVAVICNTDFTYTGDAIRSAKYDYRLTLGTGISGTADIYTKWWNLGTP